MNAASEYRQSKLAAISPIVSMIVVVLMCASIAGCGSGSGGSSQTTSTSLWVANRSSDSVTSFSASALKHRGTATATRLNQSTELLDPEGVAFDKHHNMWVTNCSGSEDFNGSITEFTHGQLGKLKQDPAPLPNIELFDDGARGVFSCPYGLQFDKGGNLWVSNRFVPNIISFSPDQLTQSVIVLPNTVLNSFEFVGPEDLLFDKEGALWIADAALGSVFAYQSSTLAAALGKDNNLDPDIIINPAALDSAAALAFDRSGNLWVANCGNTSFVAMFNAADIKVSGAPTPAITLTPTIVNTPGGMTHSLDCPEGLAFDGGGNLWVANGISDTVGSLAKFSKSQLTSSGSPPPAVFLDADANGVNLFQPVLINFGSP